MTDSPIRGFRLWPLLVLPVVALAVLVAFSMFGGDKDDAPGNAASRVIPDLGSHKLFQPTNEPAANEPPAANDAPEDTSAPRPQDPGDKTSTDHEIDTYIAHLAHATKVGDGKGKEMAHKSLASCKPGEAVNTRLLAAMQSEQHAFVRMEYFKAFHGVEAQDEWAYRVLEQRNAKYFGADNVLAPGESDELLVYARHLLGRVKVEPGSEVDPRLLAFLRSILDSEKPEWAVEAALAAITESTLNNDTAVFARSLEQELRRFLERATAAQAARKSALVLYAYTFPDMAAFLMQLEAPALRPYVAELLPFFDKRPSQDKTGGMYRGSEIGWAFAERLKLASEAVVALCKSVLEGSAPLAEKALLIQRLGEYRVLGGDALIEAGLQRRDGNLGNYLAAFGRILSSPDDIKRLVEFVGNADAAVASGAIQGLRQCGFPQAADELRRIVEQANNPGVQSQALGALLQRDPDNAKQVVETYLGPEREAAVRAVAVAHIAEKDVERIQKVVEDDASPRVRQAALARLGAMKDPKLRGFFHRVMMSEKSLLLAQEAKKYHEELKRIEEEEAAKRAAKGQR